MLIFVLSVNRIYLLILWRLPTHFSKHLILLFYSVCLIAHCFIKYYHQFKRMSFRRKKSPWRIVILTKWFLTIKITIAEWTDSRHAFIILRMHIFMKIDFLLASSFFYHTNITTVIPVWNIVHHLLFYSFFPLQ